MGVLDGLMSDPNQMGLMGLAQGLLAASGPSRIPVSMGQAMGQGLQGAQQGYVGGMGLQRQLLQMRAMQGLLGGSQPQQQQPAATTPGVPVGMGGGLMGASMPTASPDGATSPSGLFSMSGPNQAQPQSGAGIYGRSPQDLFQQGMLMNMAGIQGGGDMMRIAVEHDPTLAAQMPTDITKMGTQAGMSPSEIQAANAAGLKKANFIPPVALRTPIYFDPNTGTTQVVPADQLAQGYGAQYGAESRAKAGYQLTKVWDKNANGGMGGYVNQTVANAADAANGGAPGLAGATTPAQSAIVQTESGGNTNAVSPKGAMGAWQVMPNTNANPGFGVTPAQNNSPQELNRVGRDYYTAMTQRYGDPTIGAIAYNMGPGATDAWLKNGAQFEKLPPETRNYVGKVSTLTALNSGARPPLPAQTNTLSGGPMAAEAPPGAIPAANTAQGAPSKQMADSYKALSDSDSNYQQSRNALTDMLTLSNRQGALDKAASLLPYDWGTKVDSDAAQYAKAHSTFISQQGNALGAGGTDQARGTIEESVPTYDKPQSARTAGLNMQLNNLDYRHLKTQIMTPSFQSGDQKGFTNLSAQFDNTVKPEMMPTIMPIMQMSGQQQQSAVKDAIDKNPALRPAFEMMFNSGMLK